MCFGYQWEHACIGNSIYTIWNTQNMPHQILGECTYKETPRRIGCQYEFLGDTKHMRCQGEGRLITYHLNTSSPSYFSQWRWRKLFRHSEATTTVTIFQNTLLSLWAKGFSKSIFFGLLLHIANPKYSHTFPNLLKLRTSRILLCTLHPMLGELIKMICKGSFSDNQVKYYSKTSLRTWHSEIILVNKQSLALRRRHIKV